MEINLGLILASVINFIILLAILKHFFFGKVKAIIDEREDYINDRLDSAEEATDKARMIAIENERALNRAKEEGKAITEAHDPQLDRTVVVSKGKLNQAQLEEYQSDAIALYQQKEPRGKILSISPNTDTSALLITVDSIQKSTLKAFKKKFHDNVFLQLPPEPLTKSDGNIQFPLPPRVNYYSDKQ